MQAKTNPPTAVRHRGQRQRGVALYVVIVFALMSMLLAVWAARSALFNEILVGNDADYRRTFDAAQAMLQDAELDIRGVNPDGTACSPDQSQGDVCRRTTAVYFDIETKDLGSIMSKIEENKPTIKCFKAICQKRDGVQDFWNNSTTLAAMIAANVGARYGQFTGANAASTANPILAEKGDGKGAWYWVEMMPYLNPNVALLADLPSGSNVLLFAPSSKKLFVYRITALARGNKPGTEVVLQSTLSLQVADSQAE